MPFRRLTSEQYVKINAVAQALPPLQRHLFLAALANKISLNARAFRDREATDDSLLDKLIDGALGEVQARKRQKQQRPLGEPEQLGEDCADVTAKELERLIAKHDLS
jgi:hypothetical protein